MTTHEGPLPEKQWSRTYFFEMGLALAAYAAVLVASLLALDDTSGTVRVAVSLSPTLPFAGIGVAVYRLLRRVDERERELIYRALAFAFFGTSMVTFGYGFLENVGAPRLSMFAVWPTMGVLWMVGRWVAPRMP